MITLDKPRVPVDFNEMIEENLILLSREDTKADSAGKMIHLYPSLEVHLFEKDAGEYGTPDFLVASGLVELNTATGWSSHVRWCCRIDRRGIRHLSEGRES